MRGGLPDPIALAADLGPLVEERRLMFWSARSGEQDLLERLEIDGAIPELNDETAGPSPSRTLRETRSTATSSAARAIGHRPTSAGNPRLGTDRADQHGPTRRHAAVHHRRRLGRHRRRHEPTLRLAVQRARSGTARGWRHADDRRRGRGARVERVLVLRRHLARRDVVITAELVRVVENPDVVVTWVQPMSSPLRPIP